LTTSNDFLILDAKANDLAVKINKKLPFDATAFDICGAHIWVGDKKGSLHVFDLQLTEVNLIEGKHSKAVTVVASNGKQVASGDAYRYIFVHDGQTFEELFNTGDHKDKILDLFLTETHLISVTSDMAFGVTVIDDKKMLR
jgi:hypothetical protein